MVFKKRRKTVFFLLFFIGFVLYAFLKQFKISDDLPENGVLDSTFNKRNMWPIPNLNLTTYKEMVLLNAQHKRRLLVQKACTFAKYRYQKRFARHVHITHSTKENISFCIVPKAACTNWKKMFLAFNGVKTQDQLWKMRRKNWVHTLKFERIYYIKNASVREYTRTNFYTFMFSRHPFERLVATYRNKLVYPVKSVYQTRYGSQMLNMTRKNMKPEDIAKGRGVTFSEFVKYLIATDPSEYDEHWAIQFRFCQVCIAGYSYYGKMETLLEDAEQILKDTGLNNRYRFLYNMTDEYTVKTNDLTKSLFKNVSRNDIRKLYNVYKEDFDAFGYTVDGYI